MLALATIRQTAGTTAVTLVGELMLVVLAVGVAAFWIFLARRAERLRAEAAETGTPEAAEEPERQLVVKEDDPADDVIVLELEPVNDPARVAPETGASRGTG